MIKFTKAVLIDIVHSIMTIPAAKDEHRVFIDYCCVPKSVQRYHSITIDSSPLKRF
jgi:hypothetical protein